MASHLLYTQPGILNDNDRQERAFGIDAGHAAFAKADVIAFYFDRGLTEGMILALRRAGMAGLDCEFRSIGRAHANEDGLRLHAVMRPNADGTKYVADDWARVHRCISRDTIVDCGLD